MDIRDRQSTLIMLNTLAGKDGTDSANTGFATSILADVFWLYFKADAAQLQIEAERRGFYHTGD